MAGFSLKKYGENLIDYSLKRANKVILTQEEAIIRALHTFISDVYTKQRSEPQWQDRTWNLISSFYAVLLWNGKIVGVETRGPEFEAKNKKNQSKSRKNLAKTGLNPAYSYSITGKGIAEWRSDDKEHYPFWGGRAYANYAMRKIIGRNRKKGYVVIVGFGMPYGNFNGPKENPMKLRTNVIIDFALDKLKMTLSGIAGNVYVKIVGDFFKSTKALS